MKAMEAPKKIYLTQLMLFATPTISSSDNDVEYIRTDAFIKMAVGRLKHYLDNSVWVAKDYIGEWIFNCKPEMWAGDYNEHNYWLPQDRYGAYGFQLPQGSIKKLIGRELTWDDEPVELKEE